MSNIGGKLYTFFRNRYQWISGAFNEVLLTPLVRGAEGLRPGAIRFDEDADKLESYNGSAWEAYSKDGHKHPWSDILNTPTSLAGYGITDPVLLSSGSYANPSWLTSLAWSKITGAPSFITTETDPTVPSHVKSITTTDILNWNTSFGWGNHAGLYPLLLGSYNNPSWITGLAWSKLTGVPSTFTPSAHTHSLSDLTQSGATNGQVISWNGSAWAPTTISTANIYNSNGTLTGNRQLTLGGNSLSVLSGANTAFHLFSNGRAWFGNGTPVDAGFQLDVNGTARVGTLDIVSTGSFASGRIYRDASFGLVFGGVAGSTSDILFTNRTGATILRIAQNGNVTYSAPSVNYGGLQIGAYVSNVAIISPSGTYGTIVAGIGSRYSSSLISASGNSVAGITPNGTFHIIGALDIPNDSAHLQLNSTTRGFLPPRMTSTQVAAIATPAAGLIAYDTTNNEMDVYDGTSWKALQYRLTNPVTGTGANGQVSYWTGTGTQSGSNNLFWDATNGRLGIGTNSPSSSLHNTGTLQNTGNANFGTASGGLNSVVINAASGSIQLRGIGNPITLTPGFNGLTFSDYIAAFYFGAANDTLSARYGFTSGSTLGFDMNTRATSTTRWIVRDRDIGTFLTMFLNTGNLVLQSGGTFTDAGFRLDVNGTARVQSTLKVGAATAQNASAVLDVESTTQGFLPPRMTTAQRDAIATPAAGLIIYNTTDNKHQGYDGTNWNNFY